jgi:hypothetical protein
MATTPSLLALAAVAAEVQRGRVKFPGNRFMLAALAEEIGELAEAMVKGDAEGIHREAIQVAAVALRIAEEGDATAYRVDSLIQLIAACGAAARYLLQRRPKDLSFVLGILGGAAGRIQRYGDPTFDDITDAEARP